MRISVIIPAFNEEKSLPFVLNDIDKSIVNEIIVVNNGSTDNTKTAARKHDAKVINEQRRGYGRACLAGIAALNKKTDIVVFLDADYSDYPEEIKDVINPIIQKKADLVIGSRVLGKAEKGALSLPQKFGNALAAKLLNYFFKTSFTDLGPFRAITYNALETLKMRDKKYGWTIEMQMKAAFYGLKIKEVPVKYRKRKAGKSKVSGNIKGIILAGGYILFYLFLAFLMSMRKTNRRRYIKTK